MLLSIGAACGSPRFIENNELNELNELNMAKTININKTRKAIAEAYNVNVNYIPSELEDQFINYRKAA